MTSNTAEPVLELTDVVKVFDIKHANPFNPPDKLRAVDGATLRIMPGETYALVGESGSGTSTVTTASNATTPARRWPNTRPNRNNWARSTSPRRKWRDQPDGP